MGGKCRTKCNICFCSGFDEELAVNSRGVFDDLREEFRRPAINEEKSVKRKLRCTRRLCPRQRKPKAGGTTNRCNKLRAHKAKYQKMNEKPQYAQPLQDVNLSEGWIPNHLKMNRRPQRTKPLQDVNLSEGWVPKHLEMNRKPQKTKPLQDVNLSEGWIPNHLEMNRRPQKSQPLQDVNLSEGWGPDGKR